MTSLFLHHDQGAPIMPSLGEYSEVAICNMALADIGRGLQITSLDEASQAARACKLRYPYARDAVLRSYDWNFAARRKDLPKNAAAPAFEFTNAYDLPPDCLLVRSVFGSCRDRWVVEGRQILADAGDPLLIKYTALVSDPASFDPLFVDALAARLASDIAVQLSESVARAQSLWQVFIAKIAEARGRDSQEGQADQTSHSSWLDARFDQGFVS
jgi:hypothetical protein